ncbi:MAG TPA: Flp pilus assembly protein CpaB [Cyanobacteria bacterium UBA8530]|nr:Flp pilus assembly protein CpaB [Cyanobacteria bacterium UBA8530]
MPEIDELRSKLREKRGSGALSPPPPAPRRKKKLKPKAKKETVIAGLDVNRKMLIAALSIAGIASLLAITYLSSAGDKIMAGAAKIDVVVPAKDIPARTQISEGMLEVRSMPQGFLPKGYLGKKDDVVGKVALTNLVKEEVLLDIRVSPPSAMTGIAPKLLPNERAFILDLGEASELALIKPDDHLDLIANISDPTEKLISTPILQMVRVLSVGDRFSTMASPNPRDEGLGSGTLTLGIPASKVPLMTVLKKQGKLSVALRPLGDVEIRPPEIPEAEIVRLVMGRVPPKTVVRPIVAQPTVVYRPQPTRTRIIRVLQPRPQPIAKPKPKPHVGIEVFKGGGQ